MKEKCSAVASSIPWGADNYASNRLQLCKTEKKHVLTRKPWVSLLGTNGKIWSHGCGYLIQRLEIRQPSAPPPQSTAIILKSSHLAIYLLNFFVGLTRKYTSVSTLVATKKSASDNLNLSVYADYISSHCFIPGTSFEYGNKIRSKKTSALHYCFVLPSTPTSCLPRAVRDAAHTPDTTETIRHSRMLDSRFDLLHAKKPTTA